MHIDGASHAMKPASSLLRQPRAPKRAPKEREQGTEPAAAPLKLSESEQTVLKKLFSPSASPSRRYQALGRAGQRVRLGQYIDTRA